MFVPVEDLIMKEEIKRGLGLERYYIDMMLHGFMNKTTWEDTWTSQQLKARKTREREEARQRGEDVEGGSSPEKKDEGQWSDSSGEESSGENEEDEVGKMNWENIGVGSA